MIYNGPTDPYGDCPHNRHRFVHIVCQFKHNVVQFVREFASIAIEIFFYIHMIIYGAWPLMNYGPL